MNKNNLTFIVLSFAAWRLVLSIFLYFSSLWLPLQKDFLGGGINTYLSSPQLWAWLNFDGEHYLAIAREGYKPLSYFFFPLYPVLIRFISFSNLSHPLAISGLLISHFSILIALIGLWKIIKLDFNSKVARTTLILLLLFPTSFYFASYYTESLFLALVVWSFYFARTQNWLLAGTLGALASATRIVGIFLLPALIVEYYLQNKKNFPSKNIKKIFSFFAVLLIPLGIFSYMYFLYHKTGDPLIFKKNLEIYGEQRSSNLIILPQVFYRYIFKILPSLNTYWPMTFTILLEFTLASLFLLLSVIGFYRLRPSYWIFLIGGYLAPTFSGSFSSMSRYVLVLFPGFILLSFLVLRLPKSVQTILLALSFTCLAVTSSLFFRGYWVS